MTNQILLIIFIIYNTINTARQEIFNDESPHNVIPSTQSWRRITYTFIPPQQLEEVTPLCHPEPAKDLGAE
jgi:hypothetical protein